MKIKEGPAREPLWCPTLPSTWEVGVKIKEGAAREPLWCPTLPLYLGSGGENKRRTSQGATLVSNTPLCLGSWDENKRESSQGARLGNSYTYTNIHKIDNTTKCEIASKEKGLLKRCFWCFNFTACFLQKATRKTSKFGDQL